jgi:hypothetical protein
MHGVNQPDVSGRKSFGYTTGPIVAGFGTESGRELNFSEVFDTAQTRIRFGDQMPEDGMGGTYENGYTTRRQI